MSAEDSTSRTSVVQCPHALSTPVLPAGDPTSCKQHVRVSVFFDGTGNNLEADNPDMGHSNVARLFRAHPFEDEANSRYGIYVAGIGTYFAEIGDPGSAGWDGGALGLGLAAKGQARLDWAETQVLNRLRACDNRALRSPSAKIIDIKIAIFGFSRGAALARAFCLKLDRLCPGGQFKLNNSGTVPIEVDFLGIFDTVASVGLPTSANTKVDQLTDAVANLALPLKGARQIDRLLWGNELERLAFGDGGRPGAAPAAGLADGHGAWASELRIPALVKNGLHLVAAHEFRNSFPLDSILQGGSYPAGFAEMVLPGAHSGVGGGYEPSEGGKCCPLGSLSSMLPLWIMFNAAAKFVPFRPPADFRPHNKQDFGIDAEGQAGREAMAKAYQAYLARVPQGQSLGSMVLEHTRLYYAWRFQSIAGGTAFARSRQEAAQKRVAASQAEVTGLERAKQANASANMPWPTSAEMRLAEARKQFARDQADLAWADREQQRRAQDDASIAKAETAFAGQRASLSKEASLLNQARWKAQLEADRLQERKSQYLLGGVKWPRDQETALQTAKDDLSSKTQAYLSAKARLDTKADNSRLIKIIQKFDAELMQDAEQLDALAKKDPARKLRPHYQGLLDAYRNEFQRGRGLRDPDVIAFLSAYVHDSLAGFDHDDTRPSDPRVIYEGGDARLKYAAAPSYKPSAVAIG